MDGMLAGVTLFVAVLFTGVPQLGQKFPENF